MNKRTLAVLVVVLAILGTLAVMMSRRESAQKAPGPATGSLVLNGLDVNAVEQFEVASSSGTSVVARKNGTWVVPALYNYPADYERLARTVRALADLKVGQVIRGGEKDLAPFGLGPDKATEVRLKNAAGALLAELTVGMPKMSASAEAGFGAYPRGHYVRVGAGPVLLLPETLPGMPRTAAEWAQRNLVTVSPDEVTEASVASTQGEYRVEVTGPDQFKMDGLAKDEQVDVPAAGRLTRALLPFAFVDIADPATKDDVTGLDKPETFALKTKDGLVYTVLIGKAVPSNDRRHARLKVAYEKPQPPTEDEVSAEGGSASGGKAELERRMKEYEQSAAVTQAKADQLQAQVAPWIYLVNVGSVDNMLIKRSDLVKKVEAKKDEKDPEKK